MDKGKVLRVQGLCKKYELPEIGKEVVALEDISFEMEKGEVLGIIGRSGAGKTTLLRMLRGFEKFDDGVVEMDGVKVTKDSSYTEFRKLQKMTAIHLQRSFALWNESVLNNVIRKLRGVETGFEEVPEIEDEYEELKGKALKILDLVGLREKYNYFFPILSGGEKQKVLLARQLAKAPTLLLLDEPGTMSDPLARKSLLESVRSVKERTKISILVVSHMPEVHRYLSDRLILLDNGRIVEEGEVEAIIKKFLAHLKPVKPLAPVKDWRDTMIYIDDLCKKYELVTSHTLIKTIEMRDINFKVPRGEILGIIGPSAMGKTVLMRLLAGVERPDKGGVYFKIGTVDLANIATLGNKRAIEARSKLGILHQEFGLPPYQLVQDLFAYKLGIKKFEMIKQAMNKAKEHGISDVTIDILLRLADLPEGEARERLEKLDLSFDMLEQLVPKYSLTETLKAAKPFLNALALPEEIFERYNSELSIGEQVRLAIAVQMSSNPDVLLLDEPFGDIDPISLRMITNSLKELNRKFGTTILVVSHQLDMIQELAHEAVLIDEGNIVLRGPPEEICNAFIELVKTE